MSLNFIQLNVRLFKNPENAHLKEKSQTDLEAFAFVILRNQTHDVSGAL